MTPDKKDQRREKWKRLNFAGTIDWAVDLQFFGDEDIGSILDQPIDGHGCMGGEDISIRTRDLCEFSYYFRFCHESMCRCTKTSPFTLEQSVKDSEF